MKAHLPKPKAEIQRLKSEGSIVRPGGNSEFGFQGSFGFRPSAFGILFATALLGTSLIAAAQSFSLDWFTLDGGGGTSTGGVFAVSGTIGQPDASAQPMAGGSFSLVGGFWSLVAVQTPGTPLLTIRLAATKAATVSWPSPSTGFILQQNADFNTTNWVTAPQSVSDNGTDKFILVSPPAGNRFYRLFKP